MANSDLYDRIVHHMHRLVIGHYDPFISSTLYLVSGKEYYKFQSLFQ